MDRPTPRWVPHSLRPLLARRWVKTVLVIAVFAILGVVFMLVSDRKDASYWAGYTDGQHWIDAGGYQAHEESIAAYCHGKGAQHPGSYERGCIDGAHNAMR
ncbi:hypothetical protein ACXDF8_03165 [Mycolicibacterium sp. CBM1]